MKEQIATVVTVTGHDQLAGEYVVRDMRDDGSIVLARESEADAIVGRTGGRVATGAEVDAWFAEHGPHMLSADDEG